LGACTRDRIARRSPSDHGRCSRQQAPQAVVFTREAVKALADPGSIGKRELPLAEHRLYRP